MLSIDLVLLVMRVVVQGILELRIRPFLGRERRLYVGCGEGIRVGVTFRVLIDGHAQVAEALGVDSSPLFGADVHVHGRVHVDAMRCAMHALFGDGVSLCSRLVNGRLTLHELLRASA